MTHHNAASHEAADNSKSSLSARDLVFVLPNLAKLLWRLARDRRVPLGVKLLAIGTGVYLALPLDVIPDWLPGVGHLDDAILVGFVVHRLIRSVPSAILAEHWDGAVPLPELARKLSFRTRAGGKDPPRRDSARPEGGQPSHDIKSGGELRYRSGVPALDRGVPGAHGRPRHQHRRAHLAYGDWRAEGTA